MKRTTLCFPVRGEPVESDEMLPRWLAVDAIPYAEMWADARHWMGPLLAGAKLDATFTFEDDNQTVVSISGLLSSL